MQWRTTVDAGLLAVGMVLIIGCGTEAPEPPGLSQPAPVEIGKRFNSATAGTVRGRVHWVGPAPDVAAFEIRSLVTEWSPAHPRLIRDNPHAPQIDPAAGVGGAVIYLRGVDPMLSRPWDLPPVTVEHHDRQLSVVQGADRSHVGFVRRGDSITMTCREKAFNALHASGAAFFTLTFPDADQPLRRVLNSRGVVELSSGAGYYWMRGHLFVNDHPYYVRTDPQGRFELRQVAPGRYWIVCWMPNWHKLRQDRDPESSLVTRLEFQPALQQQQVIVIDAGGAVHVEFAIQESMFAR